MRRIVLFCASLAGVILIVSVVNCLMVISGSEAIAVPKQFVRQIVRHGAITDTLHTYTGFIHFHTTYSDGSGTYEEVTALARTLGADFIIPADHNTTRPFSEQQGSYRDQVLVIPSVEASADHGGGHFLILGTEPPLVRGSSMPSDSVFSDAVNRGMTTILAHVHHPSQNDWDNWEIGPFTGMELFNLDENFREVIAPLRLQRLFAGLLVYPFDTHAIYHIISYPARQLETFDRLNRDRKVVSIGVTDAHARIEITDNLIARFPTYESSFGIVRTYAVTREPLTGVYDHDRELILDAIDHGNTFAGFPVLADPTGFLMTAHTGSELVTMGDSLLVTPGRTATIRCELPDSTDVAVVVRCDGDVVGEFEDVASFELAVDEPGAYRIEVFHTRRQLPLFLERRLPFILSNPVYLYSAQ